MRGFFCLTGTARRDGRGRVSVDQIVVGHPAGLCEGAEVTGKRLSPRITVKFGGQQSIYVICGGKKCVFIQLFQLSEPNNSFAARETRAICFFDRGETHATFE